MPLLSRFADTALGHTSSMLRHPHRIELPQRQCFGGSLLQQAVAGQMRARPVVGMQRGEESAESIRARPSAS